MNVLLLRHGRTAWNAERRYQGQADPPLDSVGRRQAVEVAGLVAALRPDVLVSSDAVRARQTAEAIGAAMGLPVTLQDEFAEVDFGRWEGLTFREAREANPAELTAWLASPEVAPPGGESFTALARRVRRGRDAVIAAHPGRTVVVVSHVSPIKTLLRLALDAPPVSMYRIHLDTASVSMIDYFADGNCSVRLMNDTSHLAGLPR